MTEMNDATFKDFLQEYIDIKGVNLKKIVDATNIPERYIEALLEGNYQALPPAPYVRGYIGKLAATLDFDKEEMWRRYKKEINYNGSGPLDKLPANRFAIKKINKKIIIIGVLIIVIVFYFVLNFNKLLGAPLLEISYPTSNNLIVQQPTIAIEGRSNANNNLTINGTEVYVDKSGYFQKNYPLDVGLNIITITAKKFLGGENKIIKKIIYKPVAEINIPTKNDKVKDKEDAQKTN